MSIESSLNKNKNELLSNNNPFDSSSKISAIEKSIDSESNVGNDPGIFIFGENENKRNIDNISPGNSIEFNEIKNSTTTEMTPTSMFEYMMGIKSIIAKYYSYKEKEVFISKPIKVEGNVVEIELETTENHPVFDNISGKANSKQTSIEYYITYKDNPNTNDWIPILPKDETKIIGERLLIKNTEGFLRFPSNIESIKVYRNNLKLNITEYEIISNQSVSIKNYDENSVYTIDYHPNENIKSAHTIKINDYKKEIMRKVETFKGTAFNKTIELSSYPYIDYEIINTDKEYNPNESLYKPVSVRLTNASIAGTNKTRIKIVEPINKDDDKQEAYTFNKTLYQDKSWSEMIPYSIDPDSLYKGFDYYQWKNKLIFTETFNAPMITDNNKASHGIADVEISYDYLISNFRLKAIFRRNTSEEVTATPELLNYQIKFKTMK